MLPLPARRSHVPVTVPLPQKAAGLPVNVPPVIDMMPVVLLYSSGRLPVKLQIEIVTLTPVMLPLQVLAETSWLMFRVHGVVK